MCYCNSGEARILRDLQRGSVPGDALVRPCCWRTICQVRGRNYAAIDAADWNEICRQRGYEFRRQNPRGF